MKILVTTPLAIFFCCGCTLAVVWPIGRGNFNKNFHANLATELVPHSVVLHTVFPDERFSSCNLLMCAIGVASQLTLLKVGDELMLKVIQVQHSIV